MQKHNTAYIVLFSAVFCIFCSVIISGAAVGLKDYQKESIQLDIQKNVLLAAGLLQPGQSASRSQVQKLFERVKPVVIDLSSGALAPEINPGTFNQAKSAKANKTGYEAPANEARVTRLPYSGLVYQVLQDERLEMVVLPISGKGLWSTLQGFIAIDRDGTTIRGITFYQHGETPGLGGEVDNPLWKAHWPGRKAFDEQGKLRLTVIKGAAGKPAADPYQVDGISGATITSRSVTYMLHLWLGQNGYGPYLKQLRAQSHQTSSAGSNSAKGKENG